MRVAGHTRPEPDVDVGLTGTQRIERPPVAAADRAQPDRLDRDLAQEPVQELGGAPQRHLDVLYHTLARRAAVPRLEAVGDGEAVVEGDELPVERASAVATRPEAAKPR